MSEFIAYSDDAKIHQLAMLYLEIKHDKDSNTPILKSELTPATLMEEYKQTVKELEQTDKKLEQSRKSNTAKEWLKNG